MSGLQSSVGLITGIPIQETVDQLIQISAIPRDRLISRNEQLTQRQTAISELLASVIAVQISSETLAKPSIFQEFNVASNDADVVSTSIVGSPVPGSFSFQPHQLAQKHQLVSQAFTSTSTPLGEGTFRLQFGGFANQAVSLAELNGGEGVSRGKIRITDRSGASSEIDLRYAVTVDDVLKAINTNTTINVSAEAIGDSIRLTDNTGQTSSNLVVQDLGAGTTAAALGLSGINEASATATGSDVVRLGELTLLSTLNNGNGVVFKKGVADLEFTFRDNSAALQVDFEDEQTIGDIIDTLNAADPTRLSAALSVDGSGIEITDLTADAGASFGVTALFGSAALNDLGLGGKVAGDTLTGARIQAGLKTSLISSLTGGQGLGQLGTIDLTDRAGASTTISLETAETLDDVIETINGSGVGLQASYNAARNGLQITDTTGGSGNLTIANGVDGRLTADKLNLAVDAAQDSVDSGTLGLQSLSENTLLDSLNQGDGVDDASFVVYDSNGNIGAVNIAVEELTTVGDVIDAINGRGIGVQARINETGDGILLVDTAGGTGTLRVEESGNGTAAADLGILGTATEVDLQGNPTDVIDGSFALQFEIGPEDTLEDLVQNINELDAGITASTFFDGNLYRLILSSERDGRAGELLIESGNSGLQFSTIAEARDAVILYGDPDSPAGGLLATSSSNTFESIIPGVDFTLQKTSPDLVTISTTETTDKVKSSVELFVEAYNKVIDKLDEHTKFESNGSENDTRISTGILFGTGEALRVEQTLSQLATGRVFGAGSIQSLVEVGIDVADTGKLSFDEEKFDAKYNDDAQAVIEFFTKVEEVPTPGGETLSVEKGVFHRFNLAIEQLSGEDNSVLVNASGNIQSKLESNQDRIDRMNILLDLERQRLLKQFVSLEATIQSIQSSQSSLATLQAIAAQAQSASFQA